MTIITQSPEAKSSMLSHLSRRAVDVLDRTGLQSLAASVRADCLQRLDEPLYTIAFVGPFNAGKSSLVNALLGRPLLATGVLPTTAVVTELVHGDREGCDVHRADGSVEVDRPLSELPALCRSGAAVARVVVRVQAPWLAGGVRFVDTPGVQSVHEQHDRITFGYLPVADAIVLCMPASHPLSRRDLELLRDQVLTRDIRKLFFVLGQADLLSAEQAEQVERFVSQELSAVVPEPRVFCVSAADALKARQVGSEDAGQLAGLEAALRRFLDVEKEGERARRVASTLQRHLAAAADAVALQRGALEHDEAGLAGAVEQARQAVERGSVEGVEVHDRLRDDLEAVRAEARDAVELAVARVAQGTIERLRGATFDELKDGQAIEARIRGDLQAALDPVAARVSERVEALRRQAGVSVAGTLARLRAEALGAVHVAVPASGVLAMPDELFMIAEILVLDVLLPGGLLTALVAKVLGRWLSPKLGDAIGNLLKAVVVNFARGKVIQAVASGLEQVAPQVRDAFDSRLGEAVDQLLAACRARVGEECGALQGALDRAVTDRAAGGAELTRRKAALVGADEALGRLVAELPGPARAA